MPELSRFAQIENSKAIEDFVTLPYVEPSKRRAISSISMASWRRCSISITKITKFLPLPINLNTTMSLSSSRNQGILARNLVEERKIIEELFQDFLFNPEESVYIAKSDKKIVEFMTDIIPRHQHRITFNCPQNLLDQFIYDQTSLTLNLYHTDRIDSMKLNLKSTALLKGGKIDLLWECVASKRAYLETGDPKTRAAKKAGEVASFQKSWYSISKKSAAIVQLFDELGITVLTDHKLDRPLWSLANIDATHFKGLPVTFTISDKLVDIRKQMLGEKKLSFTEVPEEVQATLRPYQKDGVNWVERLRTMYLNGILADDMGLGKTLQAIVAIAQYRTKKKALSLIVCPTSLLYNWKEEFAKFDPELKVLVIDGIPVQTVRGSWKICANTMW